MNETLHTIINNLPEIIVLVVFAVLGVPLLTWLMNRMMRRLSVSKALRQLILQVTKALCWVLATLALLYSMGFTGLATTLSGSVLIIGLAISQSFKDLLGDVISGFAMARDKDFEVGFLVQIGATKGVIKDVGLRKVRLIDEDGHRHVLPNTQVEKTEWVILDREAKKQLDKERLSADNRGATKKG